MLGKVVRHVRYVPPTFARLAVSLAVHGVSRHGASSPVGARAEVERETAMGAKNRRHPICWAPAPGADSRRDQMVRKRIGAL